VLQEAHFLLSHGGMVTVKQHPGDYFGWIRHNVKV
jgi:hypothetical protein